MQLTEKEKELLKDLHREEQLCVEKYTKHAENAVDPQLKNLFSSIAQHEKGHLDTVNQISEGNMPDVSGGGKSIAKTFNTVYGTEPSPDKEKDCYLCVDALTVEKHASSLYDTSVFEFTSPELRNVLNHIQKEEQDHGLSLYDYMASNSMYS